MTQSSQILGQLAFRDYETDGVSASGPHAPKKTELRAWAQSLSSELSAILTITQANFIVDLAANLPTGQANGKIGVVLLDTTSNNGIWKVVGGAWAWQSGLPADAAAASAAAAQASALQALAAITQATAILDAAAGGDYGVAGLSLWRVQKALRAVSIDLLTQVQNAIPADPSDPVHIQFFSASPVVPGGTFSEALRAAAGYSPSQWTTLLTSAATIPY